MVEEDDALGQTRAGKAVLLAGEGDRAAHLRALADVTTFALVLGLTWRGGRGLRTETDLRAWLGKRGQVGHTVPRGFPLSNRFDG